MDRLDAAGRARRLLGEIVEESGPGVLEDPGRLASLCADEHLTDEAPREATLIADAARHDLARMLRQNIAGLGPARAIELTASSLEREMSLNAEAARWVTVAFAEAMGHSVPSATVAPPTSSQPAATLAPPPDASGTCVHGHANPVGASFCAACGAPLGALSPNPAPPVPPAPPPRPVLPPPVQRTPAQPPVVVRRPPSRWPWVLIVLVAFAVAGGASFAGVRLAARSATTSTVPPSSTTTSTLPPSSTTSTTTSQPSEAALGPVSAGTADQSSLPLGSITCSDPLSESGPNFSVTASVELWAQPGIDALGTIEVPSSDYGPGGEGCPSSADPTVYVSCRTVGPAVSGPFEMDDVNWDQVRYNGQSGYVSDEWVDTIAAYQAHTVPSCS